MSDLQTPWHRIMLLRKRVQKFRTPIVKKGVLGFKGKQSLKLREKPSKND
jgi:hypothetical protein